MMNEAARPDPDALLQQAAREGRGRLKLFLGAAPGVGKTWAMLSQGRRRRAEGVDVVVGLVETHGRAETAAQIGELPVLPRRAIPYRGQLLEEFDIDAALARRAGLLLVDELAHTNAPGSRHHKRWEDVAELLEAGLDVWATLNVQHLESLNDAVARITGIRVAETLPDRVLELANEIELIDVPPADLRARLRDGRIYRPDVARRALDGFFREGNLAALREIALRAAAQRVDQDVLGYMRQKAIAGPWPAGDRVLALVGPGPAGETVVRHAKRLADALRAPWIALHVERPGPPDDVRAALDIAAALDAEIAQRAGEDAVRVALELAAARNCTHLVVGRAPRSALRWFFNPSLAVRLLRAARDYSLHVVPLPQGAAATRLRLPEFPRQVVPWLASTALVAAVVGAGELLTPYLEHEALGMLFLAVVAGTATLWGLSLALWTAVVGFLSWNFFFIPPIYSITIDEPRDVIAIFVFLGVALATGWLGSHVRLQAESAQSRIEGLRRIVGFSRRLGEAASEADLMDEIARQAAGVADRAAVLTALGEDLHIRASAPPTDTMDEGSWAAARWAWGRKEPAGRGTGTLPSAAWRFMPMRTARGIIAVLGLRSEEALDQPELQALTSLADQGAVALERVRLAAAAARSEAQAETQKLRTALLNSLSHDLRTPLTAIRGAAGTLRSAWAQLSEAERADLLAAIEQDTVRMTSFLAKITDMTRLESGEVVPQRARVKLAEVAEAAAARVPGLGPLSLDMPENLGDAWADPTLLEQALVNVLENAVKYGPQGALVRVAGRAEGNQVAISVSDEGIGIPAADLPHVFDSFYRARLADRTAPGTGLGLAIARGLVEAMGGSISAVSPRPDMPADGAPGTIVTITVPAAST